jgi:hypothetical protein
MVPISTSGLPGFKARVEYHHQRVSQADVLPELAADRCLQALEGLQVRRAGGADADGELAPGRADLLAADAP